MTNDRLRLEWFGWDELHKLSNLSECDDVTLNLLAKPPNDRIDWKVFYQQVFTLRAVRDVLEHQGRIIIVGDPTFEVASGPPIAGVYSDALGNPLSYHAYIEPFLSWTGLRFTWDRRPGEDARSAPEFPKVERFFGAYLAHLASWSYALDTCELGSLAHEFADRFPGVNGAKQSEFRCRIRTVPFVTSRTGRAIAFVVIIEFDQNMLYRASGRTTAVRPEWRPCLTLGPLVFLPQTNLAAEEALAILLRDVCSVDVPGIPSWVDQATAPGQEAIELELAEIDRDISALQQARIVKQADRDAVRSRLRRLYQTGASLEEQVWATLDALSAEVERPEQPGRGDGWFTVLVDGETLRGVLEITGVGMRKRTIREDKLRQTKTWADRGL